MCRLNPGADDIDLDVITGVLEEQAECATSERFCRPMDVPEGLVR